MITSPPSPAPIWRLRTRSLDFATQRDGAPPTLMGIVNVTPDSFSDGGRYLDIDCAVEHAVRLEAEGAAILDIGGESTRPGAEPVSIDDELRRVLPVIERLVGRVAVPISIDTQKSAVARAALDAGAEVVNDVSAGQADPAMARVVAEAAAGVCLMHMRGTPATMQHDPSYGDVVAEVAEHLAERRNAFLHAGVDRDRICLDPGIGFGKTTDHNLALCRRIEELHRLGQPILVGHSRKRFLGEVLGDPDRDRAAATAGAAVALAIAGVQMLRVHDVAAVRDTLVAFAAVRSGSGEPHQR